MSVLIEKVLSPYLLGLQIAPKVAFAPLFIMWLGYNAWPKRLVTVLVVLFPILVNVLQSMKTVDRDLDQSRPRLQHEPAWRSSGRSKCRPRCRR